MIKTETITDRWVARLKVAGKVFAHITTYDSVYARVAILTDANDHLIIQYPHIKYPKGKPPVANPCVIPGVHEVIFVTERINKDVDVRIRRYK